MYQPVERRKVYELIAEQLQAQIGERHLAPGDVLPPERELAKRYRAGRSSVREALRMLESKGLIRATGNGSFTFAGYANPLHSSLSLLLSLEEASMHDIYELRRILECEAACLAAERRTEAHLEQMDAAIDEMAAGLASDDDGRGERYIDADLRFHLTIADATSNGLIVHTMQALRDVMRRALTSIFLIPSSAEKSLEQHRAIRAAIAAGESAGARAEMRDHLARVEADVRRVLEADGDGRG
jgi:GntR family transcriptional regulator, transcriptional repressor for pyruvate dehydrogenase complex